MTPGIIISMEQALSMTYATMRFVHMGWRVIKVEATARMPGALAGDPNRYIGSDVAGNDRRTYFVAPNVGKESIALNLKTEDGKAILKRLITDLNADAFCCNTLPARYEDLGIDYKTLSGAKPDLIWAGISAMGPDYPAAAGYDPAIQAMVGYMDVTGDPKGPPMLSGIPLVDLKAGDEVFTQIWIALAERAASGKGKCINVSMLQAAASWLITVLPMIDFGCEDWEIFRSGNEHRKFVPTNAYKTKDGAVLVAIGSNALWQRFTSVPKFAGVDGENRATNNDRIGERQSIHRDIEAVTAQYPTDIIVDDMKTARIPHAPINTLRQVIELEQIADRLTKTHMPGGEAIRMQPRPVTFDDDVTEFTFPPHYGEQSRDILKEIGYRDDDISNLIADGVIGQPVE